MALAAGLMIVMWTWVRGSRILSEKTRRGSVLLSELAGLLKQSRPHRTAGAAVFLTSDPEMVPTALMHNLKHNRVLHEKNIMLTVRTANTPRVDDEKRLDEKRLKVETIDADFARVEVLFGYMETPNVPRALVQSRRMGLDFDLRTASFFLGRRSVKIAPRSGMPLWQDVLFISLARNAANATDFYHIPSGRVVEMGQQVTV